MNFLCRFFLLLCIFFAYTNAQGEVKQSADMDLKKNALCFARLPARWDEAIPLGNGAIGTLIWQNEDNLRLTLDRADLWDLRPVNQFRGARYSYKAICEAVDARNLDSIRELIDARTQKDCAPTKLPVGAIEFPISELGEVQQVELDIYTAVCTIIWKCGAVGRFFTSAVDNVGHFQFDKLPKPLSVTMRTPQYEEDGTRVQKVNSIPRTHPLSLLGYKNGRITCDDNSIKYKQKIFGRGAYEVVVKWDTPSPSKLEGCYYVTTQGTWYSESIQATDFMEGYTKRFVTSLFEHSRWWKAYWDKSAISLPDSILEKQWYLEMYKFGSASRKNSPPISLQAIWTADNGRTPPWRGDFHNDLNTQLSYWPGYVANHLEESAVFTDWLWLIKENSETYTRQFFGVEGLNVPCIATLDGKAIGGWNQYSHQPTASGWLAQHFYLQWKYSADDIFLRTRAYPWVKEVARYFENVSVKDENGKRKLPLSSSPEINDNSLEAWFKQTTNFDLACIRFTYQAAIEMARHLQFDEEAAHWEQQLGEWPDFDTDCTGLTIAPGYPLEYTHRHLSHLLAIHPLGLLDVSQGKNIRRLIERSVHHFQELGTQGWVGYTYAWLANLQARIFDGDAAARSLHIFAKAFCSPNSFHLNGDQLKQGFSGFTYRPFTLEGNFACASAIQEMLLQSHTGIIRVFPALPESWQNVSFQNLRAMGAFLVSATYRNGKTDSVHIFSEKGGVLRIYNPFTGSVIEKKMGVGEKMVLMR